MAYILKVEYQLFFFFVCVELRLVKSNKILGLGQKKIL